MQIGVEISRALENKRIFVIDRDEVTRAAIQFMLHDENETHEFASVAEASSKSTARAVDLLVLGEDIMRAEDADELAQIERRFPGAKILLVVDSPHAAHSRRMDGVAVLAKPLTVESVRQKVNAVLGRGPGFTPLRILS